MLKKIRATKSHYTQFQSDNFGNQQQRISEEAVYERLLVCSYGVPGEDTEKQMAKRAKLIVTKIQACGGLKNALMSPLLSHNRPVAYYKPAVQVFCGCNKPFNDVKAVKTHQRFGCNNNSWTTQNCLILMLRCNYCQFEDPSNFVMTSHQLKEHRNQLELNARAPINPLLIYNIETEKYECINCNFTTFTGSTASKHIGFCVTGFKRDDDVTKDAIFKGTAAATMKSQRRIAATGKPNYTQQQLKTRLDYTREHNDAKKGQKDFVVVRYKTRGSALITISPYAENLFKNFGNIPHYSTLAEYQDLMKHCKAGFSKDGMYFAYVLLDRGMLPDDLKQATPNMIKDASLYQGRGSYRRSFQTIAQGMGLYEDGPKQEPAKKQRFITTMKNKGILVNRFLCSHKRLPIEIAETACIKFVGIDSFSNNRTYNTSMGYYTKLPRHWNNHNVEKLGGSLLKSMVLNINNSQLITEKDLVKLGYMKL